MKLGIIGLSGAGKSTVFEALTQNISDNANRTENRIGTVVVPDRRVDVLSEMYTPRKTIYAQVEYFLPGAAGKKDQNIWTHVRDCDALIHVIRNFKGFGIEPPKPIDDFLELNQEMIFADLVVVEKRLERLALDKKRGKNINPDEYLILTECKKNLENEIPLRKNQEIAHSPLLRGFGLVSARPMLVLFNNTDDDDSLPECDNSLIPIDGSIIIKGKLEQELAQMTAEEAQEFLEEFHITASAMDRVIQHSYALLGLISFFTVGEDEVRAWTIKKDTAAVEAAGVIHTDLKKGFIRAEVISYKDLMDAKTYTEARKKGTVRLEGKNYIVEDGDIMNIRFNV